MSSEQRAESSEQRAQSGEQRALSRARRSRRGNQQRAPLSRIERGAAQRRGEVPKASTPGVLRRLRLLRMTLALLLRKTISSLALGMTSLLVILAGWMPVSAQEITYNLEPTHELGPELWSIPIGGRLTMSADGTRMLVASIADSAFYVVDVETGGYRRLSQPYYSDNTFGTTFYVVDNDLTVLAQRNSLDFTRGLLAWDIDADTVVSELQAKEGTFGDLEGVSLKHDRLVYDGLLESLQTRDHIAMHDLMYAPAWFDDDRGVFYCSRDRMVGEFDAETGELKRTWGVRSLESEVRRPSNSDWLYVFSLETDFANPQNWVEAINLVTGERLTFEKYFWISANEEPHLYGTDFGPIAAGTGRAWIGGRNTEEHLQPIWIFDAEARHTNVLTDFRFYLEGQATQKRQEITPGFDRYLHCWNTNWKDSSITRCNALVPVTTSVEEQRALSRARRSRRGNQQRAASRECWLSGEVARIYNVLGMQIARLPLNNNGELSASHLEALPMQPLWAVSGDCVRRVR